MKNIVIATNPDVGYYNIMVESCKRNKLELVVLGMGKPWNGLSDKYRYWIEYLETLPDNEIVMLNDAYDVIILDTPKNITSKFKSFNKPVVFSIQKGSIIDFTFPKYFDHVVCTGNIIGYVKSILHILRLVVKHKEAWIANSDQIIFNEVISKEQYMQNNIGLDTDQTLFYVTSIEHFAVNKDISELEMKNGKLYNKSTTNNHPDKPISVLHLAANINGDKYLEHVGYNLENNKVKPPGKYKIKQIMEYVRYVLYKNSKPVLIANCSFIAIFIIGMFIYIIRKHMTNK